MCWHGLPAYWGGIMPGAPALSEISSARIVYPKPTEGIAEIEPSLMWSPAVLAGEWGNITYTMQAPIRVQGKASCCVILVANAFHSPNQL